MVIINEMFQIFVAPAVGGRHPTRDRGSILPRLRLLVPTEGTLRRQTVEHHSCCHGLWNRYISYLSRGLLGSRDHGTKKEASRYC